MKKWFAFLLLLCHMNTSMFLPQNAEADVFDESGMELNDVNSLTEFIAGAFNSDSLNLPDADDDSGQNFLVTYIELFYKHPVMPLTVFPDAIAGPVPVARELLTLLRISADVLCPPPDALPYA